MIPIILCAVIGPPVPAIHDEFAYLLQAKTFTQGRLTNPSPPGWQHFESFHIILHPTYQAKYPPGQAIFLAMGIVFGSPLFGVWLSSAMASAAIMWMLLQFVQMRWAVFATIVFATHPLVLSWGSCFWGGLVATAGGALAVGATRRFCMFRRRSLSDGLLLGIGAALLLLTRPFEGSLLLFVLLAALLGKGLAWPTLKLFTGAGMVLIISAGWMAWYNFRVTTSPFRMPYLEHDKQYAMSTPFLFLPTRSKPNYNQDILEKYYAGWQYGYYQRQRSLTGFLTGAREKLFQLGRDFFSPLFLPILLPVGLFSRRRDRHFWVLTSALALGLSGILSEIVFYPHYLAPFFGCAMIFIADGARVVSRAILFVRIKRTAQIGVAVLLAALSVSFWINGRITSRDGWAWRRAEITHALLVEGHPTIVFVRNTGDDIHQDWVSNDPNIASSPIIWAWDLGSQRNRKLMSDYPGRKAYLLLYDSVELKFNSYDP